MFLIKGRIRYRYLRKQTTLRPKAQRKQLSLDEDANCLSLEENLFDDCT